jgi:hypothetical protein
MQSRDERQGKGQPKKRKVAGRYFKTLPPWHHQNAVFTLAAPGGDACRQKIRFVDHQQLHDARLVSCLRSIAATQLVADNRILSRSIISLRRAAIDAAGPEQ